MKNVLWACLESSGTRSGSLNKLSVSCLLLIIFSKDLSGNKCCI